MGTCASYPPAVIEILRNLYFSGDPLHSTALQKALSMAGINLDSRTIRYHVSSLESKGFVQRLGKKGVILTPKGIEEVKALLVFERIGMTSLETQKLLEQCDFDIEKKTGKIIVNLATCPKDSIYEVLENLNNISSSSIIISPLIGLIGEEQRVWNINIPKGQIGIATISSTNYESIFFRNGVPLTNSATGLFKIEQNKPKGFTELICHSGTTISPGQLLCKGLYTQVSKYLETGSGYVTASIKVFPSFYCERAIKIANYLKQHLLNSVFEMGCIMPENYRMSVNDRNKGYIIVFGGANYLAPLIEKNFTSDIHIASLLFDLENMFTPKEILLKIKNNDMPPLSRPIIDQINF
ncbi:NrpR regulatory domain-containing protein [Thermovirga sp.]|uniref:NrpR regulatory domain-containing protein n=1 Tax=Thermovirga sp. TaxID=2699834 RepID=UPI0025E5AB89|nr:NrpR regulatory domain-containing protein [Thermovirga sp.]MBO8154413.1 DUF128 domain-containing protein [Thermovirga sp.]